MQPIPTLAELKKTFEHLKTSQVLGIKGIICINSNRPGPILGVSASTHGNEPSGFAVIRHLLEVFQDPSLLQCGKLYLLVNNLDAAERYFLATNEDEERDARFCDVNMNRLPKNVLTEIDDLRSEMVRARELYPLWKEFTHGLDIHSTLTEISPMIIARKDGLPDNLIRGIEIDTILLNIDQIQIGLPAFAFYGGLDSSASVFAIEAGSHKNPTSFKRAIDVSLTLLHNLGMLSREEGIITSEYKEYFISGSILFPDLSYQIPFSEGLLDFELVPKGTVLGRSEGRPDILAPFDTCPIMMTNPNSKKALSEEVMFLSQPVRKRVIR